MRAALLIVGSLLTLSAGAHADESRLARLVCDGEESVVVIDHVDARPRSGRTLVRGSLLTSTPLAVPYLLNSEADGPIGVLYPDGTADWLFSPAQAEALSELTTIKVAYALQHPVRTMVRSVGLWRDDVHAAWDALVDQRREARAAIRDVYARVAARWTASHRVRDLTLTLARGEDFERDCARYAIGRAAFVDLAVPREVRLWVLTTHDGGDDLLELWRDLARTARTLGTYPIGSPGR